MADAAFRIPRMPGRLKQAGLGAPSARRTRSLAAAALELAAVAVLAWLLARAVWFVIYGASALSLDIAAPAPMSEAAPERDTAPASYARLFADPLSGHETVADPLDLPETSLDLTLRGVRRGADAASGSAVIEAPGRGQRAIPAGGEILDRVTLAEIHADRVVIDRNGQREVLYLREEAARRAAAREDAPAASEQAQGSEPAQDEIPPSEWAEALALSPEREDGAVIGYRIGASADPGLLALTDLQTGDVVTAVNGAPLDGPRALAETAARLETASSARLTVRRGEETQQIEANF